MPPMIIFDFKGIKLSLEKFIGRFYDDNVLNENKNIKNYMCK